MRCSGERLAAERRAQRARRRRAARSVAGSASGAGIGVGGAVVGRVAGQHARAPSASPAGPGPSRPHARGRRPAMAHARPNTSAQLLPPKPNELRQRARAGALAPSSSTLRRAARDRASACRACPGMNPSRRPAGDHRFDERRRRRARGRSSPWSSCRHGVAEDAHGRRVLRGVVAGVPVPCRFT